MRKQTITKNHAEDAANRADQLRDAIEHLNRLQQRIDKELGNPGGRGTIIVQISAENSVALKTAIQACREQRRTWRNIEESIREKETTE